MSIITTKKELKKRRYADFYPTPVEVVENSFRVIFDNLLEKDDRILDTGCGLGNFGKGIRNLTDENLIDGIDLHTAYDISQFVAFNNLTNEEQSVFTLDDLTSYPILENYYDVYDNLFLQKDYLIYQPEYQYNFIVGNPPFKYAEEFINHSMDLLTDDGYLIYLLRTNFLESKSRYKGLYKKYPLSYVYTLVERISFYNNKKSDNTSYSFFVWQKGAKDSRWIGELLSWKGK